MNDGRLPGSFHSFLLLLLLVFVLLQRECTPAVLLREPL